MSGMDVVSVIAYALLGGGALLALVRLALGPSLLDRVVSAFGSATEIAALGSDAPRKGRVTP